MPLQVDLNAVLSSLTNGCPMPAEEINQAITIAAQTSTKTCLELISLAEPSMLGEAARRLTIQVFAENELWDEVLATFVELGARRQQSDAAVILHVLNALLGLSREREALTMYEHLTGQPTIEELSTASGSTASPETSTSSGRVVLPPGLLAALAVREENMQLDERHHDAAMAACHACHAWERAHALLAAVALRRGVLLLETYELGMELFEAAGEWQLCLWTLQGVLRANVAPSAGACVAALGALGVAGEWKRVVALLDDLGDWEALSALTSAAVLNAAVTALLRNGKRAEAVDLYGRISKAQVKVGRGGECFSPQAYESAIGYWATAIDDELAERQRLSKLAEAQALVQTNSDPNLDPNLDPRVSEAAPIEAAAERTEAHTESPSAAARAVRFTAAEAGAEAGGAIPKISEAGGGAPSSKQSPKPPSTPEGSKSPQLEASKSISRFGLQLLLTLTLTPNPNPDRNPSPSPSPSPNPNPIPNPGPKQVWPAAARGGRP